MATIATVLAFARAQAQTDSNGLTDANGIIFANEALLDFRRKLLNKNVDAAQIQEAYRDASAGQGTYLYPTTPQFWFIKAIELNLTSINDNDYKTATQVDVSNIPGGASFSWLRKNADRNNPLFDDHGDWYEIFPTPLATDNLVNAIRLIGYIQPPEYSATTDTVSYPESLDYRILGTRIAADYKDSLEMGSGDALNAKYEQKVQEFATTLARGTQQPLQAVPIQLTGWQF